MGGCGCFQNYLLEDCTTGHSLDVMDSTRNSTRTGDENVGAWEHLVHENVTVQIHNYSKESKSCFKCGLTGHLALACPRRKAAKRRRLVANRRARGLSRRRVGPGVDGGSDISGGGGSDISGGGGSGPSRRAQDRRGGGGDQRARGDGSGDNGYLRSLD